MSEKQTKYLRPVKLLGLQDDMYPRFNFLKQRLLSIYPRFKAAIEREKLDELVLGGQEIMQTIDDAVEPLNDTVELILMGCHELIEDKQIKDNFIASSRCRFKDNETLIKQTLVEDTVFELDEIQKIAARPVVIVYVVQSEEEQSFEEVASSILPRMPINGGKSLILCSESCRKYVTLQAGLGHNTLGKLVQACLEEKVVAVLQLTADFIQKDFFPEILESEVKRGEMLKQPVSKTLQEAIKEMKDGNDADSIEMHNLYDNIKKQICENLSRRCGAEETLMKMVYEKESLGEIIKKYLKNIQDVFRGHSAVEKEEKRIEVYVEKINGYLRDYESKWLEIFHKISMIDFEIKGVFRQAKLPVRSSPDISNTIQERILSISGVYGCGVMLGNLVVHVEEYSGADVEEVTNKVIDIVMKSESKYFVNHLQVKRIRILPTANATYESGQVLRVKKPPCQAGASADDNCLYGTLGCFVKGKNNGFSEKLYAVSCAHVFPDDCDAAIEIALSRTQDKFDMLGVISPDFKILRENKVDIAAVAVESSAEQKCNHCLKNSGGCDVWKSALHEGDLKDIIGYQVYKWGFRSGLTRGLIISENYISSAQRGLDSQYNIFIKSQKSSEKFSSKGDSGSAVCFDEPTEEIVQVLSLVTGELTETVSETHLCSYSCHLKTNLDELSKKTGNSFELYNP